MDLQEKGLSVEIRKIKLSFIVVFFSPGFTKFLNVMLALDGFERKSVVQFITGCSSLPPGGLANLRPRLSVARKVEADDNSYPSVNTCYHYLKLPDYSNEEILKMRLMTACKERGFYFN
jgi:E3 ubiquitin-protein ligase HECTD1